MKSKILAVVAGVLLGTSALWGYTWILSRDLNTSSWSNNFMVFGSLSRHTYGGYSGVGGAGQMIYNASVYLTSANMVLRVPGSSGYATFSEYLGTRYPLTGDTGPVGPFIETDISISPSYSSIQVGYGSVGSVASQAYVVITPHDNMTVMTVLGAWPGEPYGYKVGVYVDNNLVLTVPLHTYAAVGPSQPLAGGGGGFGANGTGSGYLISHIDIGQATGSPVPIPSGSIGISPFTNHIDLTWPAASDGTGMGITYYEIWRNGAKVGSTTGLTYSDTTVNPSTPYSYTLKAFDYFFAEADTAFAARSQAINSSPPYPSSSPEGRRIGVRTTGAYWGASPENIDVRSGNLSFSIPILTAQGRAGLSASFNLSYNSQNWRNDSVLDWQFDGDVGYGFGWRLLAGSITPVWNTGGMTAAYFLFMDSTGAEYRLD